MKVSISKFWKDVRKDSKASVSVDKVTAFLDQHGIPYDREKVMAKVDKISGRGTAPRGDVIDAKYVTQARRLWLDGEEERKLKRMANLTPGRKPKKVKVEVKAVGPAEFNVAKLVADIAEIKEGVALLRKVWGV